MFGKLLAIILVFGVIGCALLVNRQKRIEAAHDLTRLHQRMQHHERTLWELRARIAERCRPEQIRLAQERMPGDWRAYIPELFTVAPDNTYTASAAGEGGGLGG